MRHSLWTIASIFAISACSSSSTTPAASPTDDASDTSSDSTPRSHSSHSSSSDDAPAGNAIGTGPTVSIGAIPCHTDEAAPPPQAAPPTAKGGKPAPAAKGGGDASPPTTKAPITIAPVSLGWKIDKKQLASIYDHVVDGDYKERYDKVQPGIQMQSLDAEVQEQKDIFRRSELTFDDIPTGVDASPLKGEYTYRNKEMMMKISRNGKTRDFFFIQGKLWKIVDELPLGDGQQWGKDFQEAVVKISGTYGVPGRVCPADPAKGRYTQEVDWKDGYTQVRAVDWQNGKFGLIFVDLGTLNDVAGMRSSKAVDASGVDPSVQDIMHTPTQPPPKDDKSKDKDKNKGKKP